MVKFLGGVFLTRKFEVFSTITIPHLMEGILDQTK